MSLPNKDLSQVDHRENPRYEETRREVGTILRVNRHRMPRVINNCVPGSTLKYFGAWHGRCTRMCQVEAKRGEVHSMNPKQTLPRFVAVNFVVLRAPVSADLTHRKSLFIHKYREYFTCNVSELCILRLNNPQIPYPLRGKTRKFISIRRTPNPSFLVELYIERKK